MKTKYSFIDPGAIMGVVVALIILGVGTYAFFVTVASIPNAKSTTTWGDGTYNMTANATNNVTGTGTQVFNIIGIVLVIGAIMAIVGLVYNYVR